MDAKQNPIDVKPGIVCMDAPSLDCFMMYVRA